MKPSQTPTSQYEVFCDTYDMKATAKIHKVKGKQKLELTLKAEDGTTNSISLYREDVDMLSGFLGMLVDYVELRNPEV